MPATASVSVISWFSDGWPSLPAEPTGSRPRLLLARARLAVLSGRLDEAERLRARARELSLIP